MQLYILSPAIVYLMYRFGFKAIVAYLIMILGCVGWTLEVHEKYHLKSLYVVKCSVWICDSKFDGNMFNQFTMNLKSFAVVKKAKFQSHMNRLTWDFRLGWLASFLDIYFLRLDIIRCVFQRYHQHIFKGVSFSQPKVLQHRYNYIEVNLCRIFPEIRSS